MSIIRSDSRNETHNKPVQDGERKLSGGIYIDYATTAEVIAAIGTEYRKNKYFWVAGVRYHCDSDGTTFRTTGINQNDLAAYTLKSDFNSLRNTTNLLRLVNLINYKTVLDGYILSTTAAGTITANPQYGVTDYIAVLPNTIYYGINTAHAVQVFRNVVFYTSNFTWISSLTASSTQFTTPANCAWVRMNLYSKVFNPAFDYNKYGLFIETSPTFTPYETLALNYAKTSTSKPDVELANVGDVKAIVAQQIAAMPDTSHAIDVCKDIVKTFKASSNLIDPSAVTDGYYINPDGTLTAHTDYGTADYIPCKANTLYTGVNTANAIQVFRQVSFFNSGKVNISGIGTSTISFTTPAGCAYVRMSLYSSNFNANYAYNKYGLFEGSAPVFEPYYKLQDLQLKNNVTTSSKIDSSIATLTDVNAKAGGGGGSAVTFTRNGNAVVFSFPGGGSMSASLNGMRNNNTFEFEQTTFKDISIANSDDIAPAHIQSTTLGGNHGQTYNRATVGTHGLTNTSVGTAWTHSDGKTYYIIAIPSATELDFLSANAGTRDNTLFTDIGTGTITRSGTTFTITAVSGQSFYPGTLNASVKLIANGSEVVQDGTFASSFVDVVERYTIKNYDEILTNLIANAGTSTPQYTSSGMMTFENIYRFLPNAAVLVIVNMMANQGYRFANYMFSQAIKVSAANDVAYYVPNSLPVVGYDFRKPLTVAWSTSVPQLYLDNTTWKDATNPPRRVIQYYKNTAFAFGYLKDYGVGKALQNYTSQTFELRNNTGKVYPHGVDSIKMGNMMPVNAVYSAIIYRCYIDLTLTKTGGRMSYYYFTYNNITYVFIDYSATMQDHVVIDNSLNGKAITALETVNTTLISDFYNNGFYVQVTYVANETCFAVLKIS